MKPSRTNHLVVLPYARFETPFDPLSVASDYAPRVYIPAGWAIDWAGSDGSRRQAQAVLGLSDHELAEVAKSATDRFDEAYGVWSVIFELSTARELRSRLPGRDLDLWGVAMPAGEVESFAPDVNRSGVDKVVLRGEAPAPGGEILGFEILTINMGHEFNSPRSVHEDEDALLAGLDVDGKWRAVHGRSAYNARPRSPDS